MPRNVRNAWVTLAVDGRKSNVATGPRAKRGGVHVAVDVRKDGEVHRALEVAVISTDDGRVLRLDVEDGDGNTIYTKTFNR